MPWASLRENQDGSYTRVRNDTGNGLRNRSESNFAEMPAETSERPNNSSQTWHPNNRTDANKFVYAWICILIFSPQFCLFLAAFSLYCVCLHRFTKKLLILFMLMKPVLIFWYNFFAICSKLRPTRNASALCSHCKRSLGLIMLHRNLGIIFYTKIGPI